MSFTPKETALQYAAYGWHVIPVMGKRPVGEKWQERATCDPSAVEKLFTECPHDGVGVQLGERSGLIDFDCDSVEAEETITKLFEGVEDHETPFYQSARGKHYLYRWTDKLPRPDLIKIVVDGLEIRTGSGDKGAQSVFPPSGDRVWLIDPSECPLAEIPEEVITRIKERYDESQKPKKITPRGYTTTSTPDEALNVPKWLSSRGREIIGRTDGADGTTRFHIECPGLLQHTTGNSWRDCCITQTSAGVLGGSCFHSSCGMRDWEELKHAIGAPTHEDYHGEVIDYPKIDPIGDGILSETVAKPLPDPKAPTTMGDAFFEIPGLIGEMIKYHKAYAPRSRPELALMASIALTGALSGRKIRWKSNLRTNIYCIGLSPSAGGKDGPRNFNQMAMVQAKLDQTYLGSESPASDSALINDLADNPSMLVQIDEVSHFFATFKAEGNSSSNLKNLKKLFLELVGASSNPAWSPKSWADRAKRKIIQNPHFCLYGTSTTKGFWDSVSTADAQDGFLARMMIVESSSEFPRLRDIEPPPFPPEIIDVMKDWHSFKTSSNDMDEQGPQAITIHVDSAAMDRIQSHSNGVEDQINDDDEDLRPIWARASALVKRLSLIFAASRGPGGIAVKLEDAEMAVKLANWCTRLLIRRVFTHVSYSEAERERKKVLEIIRKHGVITATQLNRKTGFLKDARTRREIITDLREAEYIEICESQTTGRPTICYRVLSA